MAKPIKTTLLLAVPALAIAAATLACSSATPPPAADPFDAEQLWHDVMEDVVSPGFDDVLVPQSEADAATMDYPAISRAAGEMAQAIAQGYGRLEQPRIPEFGKMARDAEAWLRQVQRAAEEQDAAAVRRLVAAGEPAHCDLCHQRADEAK